jgi:hypothetical protein
MRPLYGWNLVQRGQLLLVAIRLLEGEGSNLKRIRARGDQLLT